MVKFCKAMGLDKNKVCFMFSGKKLSETATANSVGLKNGDNIDVFELVDSFKSQIRS